MTVTCLQISDVHMRADGGSVYERDPAARLRSVLERCEREIGATDLLALSGDQSDDGEPGSMRRVEQILAELHVPRLAVRGNHDESGPHLAVFGSAPAFELGGWRVIGVQSALSGEIHGAVDVGALECVLDGLDARPTLLMIHHPPVPPIAHPWFRLEHAEELLSLLAAREHVRGVISGHVHVPFVLERGSLRLLGAPSTLAAFGFEGGEISVDPTGPTGARAIMLREDGSFDSVLVDA